MIKCRLKILLAEHDMTQKELSEKTGIRLASIGDMCNNKAKHIPIETNPLRCHEDFAELLTDRIGLT